MDKYEAIKIFEHLTIEQLKRLTTEFLTQRPDFQTAEDLLQALHQLKEAEKIKTKKQSAQEVLNAV